MPRYFFDLYHGEECFRDDEGTELPSLSSASMNATATVITMADIYVMSGRTFQLGAAVRDQDGQTLMQAKFSLDAEHKLPVEQPAREAIAETLIAPIGLDTNQDSPESLRSLAFNLKWNAQRYEDGDEFLALLELASSLEQRADAIEARVTKRRIN